MMTIMRRIGGEPSTQRVLEAVARFEAADKLYEATNPNRDGNGLSLGLIQWGQGGGQLGRLLAAFRAADTPTFDALVGGPSIADELLRRTNASSQTERLGPVAGRVLWDPTWLAIATAMGRHPPFQAVQRREALQGEHWQFAGRLAAKLAPGRAWSERARAVFYDRVVQTWGRASEEVSGMLSAHGASLKTMPEAVVLDILIERIAARYGRGSDTYRDIRVRRGNALLTDPNLSDAPLPIG